MALLVFWLIFRGQPAAASLCAAKGGLPRSVDPKLVLDKLYRCSVMIVGLVMAADQLGINVAAAW